MKTKIKKGYAVSALLEQLDTELARKVKARDAKIKKEFVDWLEKYGDCLTVKAQVEFSKKLLLLEGSK